MPERREHPVLWGLVALVTVAAFLGLILGVGTLVVSRMAGIGGGGGTAEGNGESMFLPSPSDTVATSPVEPTDTRTKPPRRRGGSQAPAEAITLTAGQSSVSPMQEIDLTGRYPGGDGAILQVQRFEGGRWVDFPVTMSVTGDTFSTYVQTGQTGANKFRVADATSGDVSNPISVTVG